MARRRRGPRLPTTAYFWWMSQNRARLKRENPQMNALDLMRLAGSQWNAMTADEKRPWEETAAAARRRFKIIFGPLGYCRRRPRITDPLHVHRPFMAQQQQQQQVRRGGVARHPARLVRNAPPTILRPPQPAAPVNNNAPPITISIRFVGDSSTAWPGSQQRPPPAATATPASGSRPAPSPWSAAQPNN